MNIFHIINKCQNSAILQLIYGTTIAVKKNKKQHVGRKNKHERSITNLGSATCHSDHLHTWSSQHLIAVERFRMLPSLDADEFLLMLSCS